MSGPPQDDRTVAAGLAELGIPPSARSLLADTRRTSHSESSPTLDVSTADPLPDQAQLCQRFGLPPTLVFQTTLLWHPPTLPTQHVSRCRLFPDLARCLGIHSTTAVVAYPNSGKTIVVAEFARAHPSGRLWFSLPTHAAASESWYVLLCWKLAQFLELDDIDPQGIASALARRVIDAPILLVIDNAQQCNDLTEWSLFRQVAEASNQRFQIILIATDEPAFRTKANAAGIAIWPCPGMNEGEAEQLYERLDGPLTDIQRVALQFLVSKTDGHIGLLRLEHRRVKAIQSAADCSAYIAALRDGLGSDAESKRIHIVERFRAGLSEDDFTLCKIAAMPLDPFAKRIAQAVWTLVKDAASFPAVWNRCVVAAFDVMDNNRYSLPDLYQQGCREFCTPDESQRWNLLIADALEQPMDGTVDPSDIANSIAHRVIGGQPSDALKRAALFLMMVRGKHRNAIRKFLAFRFDLWLSRWATSGDVDADARVVWHSIWSQVCRELGWPAKETESLTVLEQTLLGEDASLEPTVRAMGWSILLSNASASGNVDLAVRASTHLSAADFPKELSRHREFCLFSAYMVAKQNPLPLLQRLVDELAATTTERVPLWGKHLDFHFWRHVGITMYFSRSKAALSSESGQAAEFAAIGDVVRKLRAAGECHVATVIGASLVRMLIDIGRDFTRALAYAMELATINGITDPAVQSHLKMTIADTLRCSGDQLPAEQNYREALATWPKNCEIDRIENLSLLAITVAKQGRLLDAAQMMRQAARNYEQIKERTLAARCRLEAACLWSQADKHVRGVHELIAARSLVKKKDASCPEWVLLGQLAMSIAARAGGGGEFCPLPVPGFTLAIDGPIQDAQRMKSSGPTITLAKACEVVGLPHRAAAYYDIALDESDEVARATTAVLAVQNAIAVGDLARAAFLAGIACRAPQLLAMNGVESQEGCFDIGNIIGPVVFAFINDFDDRQRHIESALSTLSDPTLPANEALQALRTTLNAILLVERDGDTSGVETAYRTSSSARMWIVARHLTWYWLFRATQGRPSHAADYIQWLWRYCRLTVLVGRADTAFFTSSLEQFKTLLTRVGESSGMELLARASRRASDSSLSPSAAISSSGELLAEWSASQLEVSTFLAELRDTIRSGSITTLGNAVDSFITRLLSLILLPLADEHVEELREGVNGLATALNECPTVRGESLSRWQAAARKLIAMVDTLESGKPSPLVFDALLEWRNEQPPKLPPPAATNYYIWLRHMISAAGRDPKILPVMWASVGGEHAALLLHDPEVPEFLRRRLGICHWVARGYLANRRLLDAIVIANTQQQSQIPIRSDRWDETRDEIGRAIADVKLAVEQLKELASAIAKSADTSFDHWSSRMEAAGLRQMVGALLWKRRNDPTAVKEWLQPALEDFRDAARIAKAGGLAGRDPSLVIRPAVQGRFLARAIQDEAAERDFDDLLAQEPTSPEHQELLRQEESLSALDPILNEGNESERRFDAVDDAQIVDQLVDQIMKASGLPEDRRPFVTGDARKCVVIERVQQEFCRHLQPLQNLLHTRSPATAFAGPTQYTGSCTLLGHQTQIECENIETVIGTFQRFYCENCQHRSPKAS